MTEDNAAQNSVTAPAALVPVSVRGMTNIFEALHAKGKLDDQLLRELKFAAVNNDTTPEKLLLDRNLVSEDTIQQTKSEMYGIGYADLNAITVDPQVLSKIPKEVATRNQLVAFEQTDTVFKVAMVDPLDLQKVKFAESYSGGKRIEAYYASGSAIQRVIDTKYGAQITAEVDEALADVSSPDSSTIGRVADLSSGNDLGGAPVTKIVNLILDYAIKHDASDIHVEPREAKVSVRYRIHGILSEKLTVPAKLSSSLISRIKILANLKIDEHRVPQDGRFPIKSGDKMIDVRVSIMPSIYGEKVVMRLLEKGASALPLEESGLRGPGYKQYRSSLERTQGIILITGPTGSGKTVTLASSLALLNKQEVNIVTIEDPVEIRIEGITQVQVNPEVGLTFATGMRSFLRQDPDIIMVGEIRDSETAELAVQAALTGHLVLATLHTNSAAGALPRLLDMGVPPFLLSSTVNLVVAQRLVRKLCEVCKQPIDADPTVVEMLHRNLDGLNGFDLYSFPKSEKIHFDSQTKKVTLYKPVGCPKCSDTGYEGRIGIFEVMNMTPKLGQMVMSHLSSNDLQQQAVKEGMITMTQDGLMKSLEGLTTIEEVLRVQKSE